MTAYSDGAADGKLGGDYVPGIGACMTVYQVQFKNMNPFFANAPLHSGMRWCRYMFSYSLCSTGSLNPSSPLEP